MNPNSSGDWLEWLASRRDGFIAGGAVFYGLGYLVWSFNAWANGWPQLPALDFQYFAAGLFPAFILMIMYLFPLYIRNKEKNIINLLKTHVYTAYLILTLMVLLVLFLIYMSSIIGILVPKDTSMFFLILAYISIISLNVIISYFILLSIYSLYLKKLSGYDEDKKELITYKDRLEPVLEFYRFILPLVVGAFLIFSCVLFYDKLPRVLGGPAPRCAYIDLALHELAPQSASNLTTVATASFSRNTVQKVTRSAKLNVYFSNENRIIVRRFAEMIGRGDHDEIKQPLFEIKMDVVRAIQWCDEGTAG